MRERSLSFHGRVESVTRIALDSQPDDTEVVRTKSKSETQVLSDYGGYHQRKNSSMLHKYIDKYKFKCQYTMQRLMVMVNIKLPSEEKLTDPTQM